MPEGIKRSYILSILGRPETSAVEEYVSKIDGLIGDPLIVGEEPYTMYVMLFNAHHIGLDRGLQKLQQQTSEIPGVSFATIYRQHIPEVSV